MLKDIGHQFAVGGAHVTDGTLAQAIKQLQGLTVSVVAGAAAGVKMNVAALRAEDTLLAAVVTDNLAVGAPVNDVANLSIVVTTAQGTITVSGNPVEGETITVNGHIYTMKAVPTAVDTPKITAGDNTAMAAAIALAINSYENRMLTAGYSTPEVVASSVGGVVTVIAVEDGAAGNAITLTEAATNVAVTGAGTLTGGSDTGGITSTTVLTDKTVTLTWFNHR